MTISTVARVLTSSTATAATTRASGGSGNDAVRGQTGEDNLQGGPGADFLGGGEATIASPVTPATTSSTAERAPTRATRARPASGTETPQSTARRSRRHTTSLGREPAHWAGSRRFGGTRRSRVSSGPPGFTRRHGLTAATGPHEMRLLHGSHAGHPANPQPHGREGTVPAARTADVGAGSHPARRTAA